MLGALMPGSRNIISVELVPSADAVLKKTVKRTKLAKKDVIARLCEWFAEQDVEIQRVVLGEIPDSLAGAAKELVLKKMRGRPDDYVDNEAEPITPSPAPDLGTNGKPPKQ